MRRNGRILIEAVDPALAGFEREARGAGEVWTAAMRRKLDQFLRSRGERVEQGWRGTGRQRRRAR